jgi:orotate phosphoribosyltransferase-like protein
MPVVNERLITKAMALRKRGRTQEEIAVELGVVQGTALAGSWSRRKS